MSTVLIAGASGLVGTAAVNQFLDAGWKVYALSRRRPLIENTRAFIHLAVDLRDPEALASMIGAIHDVTHVFYAALYEMPGLMSGWQNRLQMDTNLCMLRNLMEPLIRNNPIEHVTLLQGTKAYGVHLHPVRIPLRESFPRDNHANFYFLQEDYLKSQAISSHYNWTIFRPVMVVGPNIGVAMNVIPVIGAYAAICHARGEPFGFPGDVPFVHQVVDARLIGDAGVWAATHRVAWGEYFNLTNGEVSSWLDLWPSMADCLNVPLGPQLPRSMASFLPENSHVWDNIVQRHHLHQLKLAQLIGESHNYADFEFGFGLQKLPLSVFSSSIKIKQAGFTATFNTESSVCHWLKILVERNVIPRY